MSSHQAGVAAGVPPVEDTAAAGRVLRSLRAARVLLHIGTGFALALAVGAFLPQRLVPRHRPLVRRAARWWLARLTRVLRVEASVVGTPVRQPALYVSNHVSWLDIPVLGGLTGVHFLSKAEVGEWPLIGPLATAAGTLYIRRGHGQVRERARQIGEHIACGRPVLVFPEGTTTDGRDVRGFHAPLFSAACDGGHPVQPVAIRYLDERGGLHPWVPFIGEDEFTGHLWRLLGAGPIRVEVHFLPAIGLPVHGAGSADHRELAARAHAAVRQVIVPA